MVDTRIDPRRADVNETRSSFVGDEVSDVNESQPQSQKGQFQKQQNHRRKHNRF